MKMASLKTVASALLLTMAACSAPAWRQTGWLREDIVRAVEAYFPGYRIFERDVEILNRNLQWYTVTAILDSIGEEPLFAPCREGATIVRFTWMGAFQESLVIRAREMDGRIRLGKRAGSDVHWVEKEIGAVVWADLIRGVDELMRMPACDGSVGVDGGWWTLEVRKGERFWHAERWSPEGPFRVFCDRLARLADVPQAPY